MNTFKRWLLVVALSVGMIMPVSPVSVDAHALTGAFDWVRGGGGAISDLGRAVVVDSTGNVYVAGNFQSQPVAFGATSFSSAGQNDAFVAKYSPTGALLWAQRAGSTANDLALAIALDPSGNPVITGALTPVTGFGNFGWTQTDVYAAKLDQTTGSFIWVRKLVIGSGADSAYAIETDTAGNIYVGGNYSGFEAAFGDAEYPARPRSYDAFVMKITSNGSLLWHRTMGSAGTDNVNGLAVDAAGSVYVTGYGTGDLTIGSTTLTSMGGTDSFVAKYSSAGALQWARRLGGTGEDMGLAIAARGSEVVASGSYVGTASYSGSVSTLTSVGDRDGYVMRLDQSTGDINWANSIGGAGSDRFSRVAIASDGNVYASGFFTGTATIGTTPVTSSGATDAFFAHYDADGTYGGVRVIQASVTETAFVTTDSTGGLAVAGSYQGSMTLDGNTITSAGGPDVFVAHYRF